MFSNPLKQAAEDYLYTNDSSVRERTQQQLLSAGPGAVAPLIDALIITLRKLKSASWGKREMGAYVNAIGQYLGDQYSEMLRQQLRGMPDRDSGGISLMHAALGREARAHAWQIISQLGESGVRTLFTIINSRDKLRRVSATLILSAEERPNRFIVNSILTSTPFQETFGGTEMDEVVASLLLRSLAFVGERNAIQTLNELCAQNNMSIDQFNEVIVDSAISVVAHSR